MTPEIQFPAPWEFRIITVAEDADDAIPQLEAILSRYGAHAPLQKTTPSRSGKYRTLFTSMTIPDRPTLEAIGKELAAVKGVKMIL